MSWAWSSSLACCVAAGLEATGPGFSLPEYTLLLDWAGVARKLGKVPSVHEYESAGRFSNMPFHTRYHVQATDHQSSAKKLGRNPNLRDLRLLGRVSEQLVVIGSRIQHYSQRSTDLRSTMLGDDACYLGGTSVFDADIFVTLQGVDRSRVPWSNLKNFNGQDYSMNVENERQQRWKIYCGRQTKCRKCFEMRTARLRTRSTMRKMRSNPTEKQD